MATLLLKKGAKLDPIIASFGLQRAVEAKNTDMLSFLLKNNADPNSTYMGAPPLVTACQSKDTTMIRIHLESGADINLKSKYPNMPVVMWIYFPRQSDLPDPLPSVVSLVNLPSSKVSA